MCNMRYPEPEIDREVAMKLWEKEHSDYAKEQVILSNAGMVGIVLKSMNLNPLDEYLFQIGMVGLVKNVNTFNPDRGVKFTTYATPIIRNEILMSLKKKRIVPAFSLDEEYRLNNGESVSYSDMIPSTERFEELSDSKLDLDVLFEGLSEREKEIAILSMRGARQTDIAQRIGVSQSYISRILKGIQKKANREVMV